MRYLLLSFLILATVAVKADAWDNLTLAEAEMVQKKLNKDPFVFDFCDCCSDAPVYLLKVLSSEIVTCSWDETKYSVKINATRIGKFGRDGVKVDWTKTIEFDASESRLVDYTIYMNYTFMYKKPSKAALPVAKVVPYHYEHQSFCEGIVEFPNPAKHAIEINDADYQKWYKKRF